MICRGVDGIQLLFSSLVGCYLLCICFHFIFHILQTIRYVIGLHQVGYLRHLNAKPLDTSWTDRIISWGGQHHEAVLNLWSCIYMQTLLLAAASRRLQIFSHMNEKPCWCCAKSSNYSSLGCYCCYSALIISASSNTSCWDNPNVYDWSCFHLMLHLRAI